ncbi:MAG TPA: response regulator [Chloroflexota bacterium]|jgi:CheY-like chemotaxis protein
MAPHFGSLTKRGTARVAIVEDDEAIRLLIQDVLEDEGYVCLANSSADTGMDLVERHRPDVLILDIKFGSVASGWRLLDQLGRNPHTAGIAVILCTADSRALESQQAALVERGIRCLAKPFDVADLLRLVRESLQDVGALVAAE